MGGMGMKDRLFKANNEGDRIEDPTSKWW
jgi:hypothetical protein